MHNDTITIPDIIEPGWCDPRMCDADEPFLGDRLHILHDEDVRLSLHDREHREDGEDYVHFVQAFINQPVSDAATTLGLFSSRSAPSSATVSR